DPSTAELFTFLIGEARQNKLMVIGTLTIESGADGNGNAMLAQWEQRARDANFPLLRVDALTEPLVREHLQSLLGEQNVPDEFVRWMLWESAGSPLNIRRVIDYLIAHHYLRWQPSGCAADMERIRGLRIPGGAASILMEKVDALSPNERAALEAAAVFGEVSDVDLLTGVGAAALGRAPEAGAAPHESEAAYVALRSLIEQDLLDESSDGKTV